MLKEKILPISIFCLAISIIISSFILTKGIKSNGEYIGTGLGNIGYGLNSVSSSMNPNNYNSGIPKDNYSLAEAAIYLRITEDRLLKLVNNDSGIPYVKVGDNYIFNKNAIDKWLETAKIKI